ncbi:ADP-ribose pyrophosphatase [Caulifigura coniformis]|uniref:GDP-mannose pyrophosphatase n=1 Tax=Caulifigura coniformis TaxID=2527983 RepID=A0A517SFT5_9PLAN|nr:NUDIX hydrolase [Caulifigura coniformis]QDT54983.1 ADP-ribose pyrophosphatase [Caulifigura coniformis]
MKKSPRKVLAEGRYLRMVTENGWEYAERSRGLDAVAVIAVTDANELILTEQFRVPLKKQVLDLPAGLVGDDEDGEDLVVAAKRELEEETGYRAARMKKVFSGPTSAGLSSEVVNLFLATGIRKIGDGGGVADEAIVVHHVPLEMALPWLRRYERRAGGMVSPNVIAALALIGS